MCYTRVKICGITNLNDAKLAIKYGADALGFIFCESPRQISISQAMDILPKLPPYVNRVAVVKDFSDSEVREIIHHLPVDSIQFHGSESEEFCLSYQTVLPIKVISVQSDDSLKTLENYPGMKHYLLDTYTKAGGGSGRTFNWELAVKAKTYGNIVLAGGLEPGNIKTAIQQVKPYGVDVSSGVEQSPGIKDPDKLRTFIEIVKSERKT
ncbi:MAG: phosphoribosylanthranilate isomerase [Spirochaetota bacterium]|nr:phosphoribosylanthranilate isomerase [Spirochaetota bacterium]